MRLLHLAGSLLLVVGLAACSSDPVEMPDVVGKRLDVAKSDVEGAGLDEPEVLGGGMFGIVVESNWTVCEQKPAAGSSTSDKPTLTVARSCGDDSPGDGDEADDSAEPTPTAAEPEAADITVDELLDRLNAGESGGIKLGDRFRLTGELFQSDAWGVGAADEYTVYLKAKGGKDDLLVFAEETDAETWKNGTQVEMIVKVVEATIDGETSDGWLKAESTKTLSGATTKKAKAAGVRRKLFKALHDYAESYNQDIGTTVFDGISPGGNEVVRVDLNLRFASAPILEAQAVIAAMNQEIVDIIEANAPDWMRVKYYLANQMVAENRSIMDPWEVRFKGMLDD